MEIKCLLSNSLENCRIVTNLSPADQFYLLGETGLCSLFYKKEKIVQTVGVIGNLFPSLGCAERTMCQLPK